MSLKSLFFGALCAIALLVPGASAESGVRSAGFGTDDRIGQSRDKGTPFGAIGLVAYDDGTEGKLGTGFLVAPCYILTAYHVVSGKNRKLTPADLATFYVGEGSEGPNYSGSRQYAAGTTAHPVVWGDFLDSENGNVATRIKARQSNGWQDWVLMKLDRCFGDPSFGYGYLRLKPISTRELTRSGETPAAIDVGLPQDRGEEKLTEDPSCRVLGQIYQSGWQHDCLTQPGNSGGPLLEGRASKSGEWPRVLALTVASRVIDGVDKEDSSLLLLSNDDPSYFSLLTIAVPVSAFINRIAQYLPPDPEVERYVASHHSDTGYALGDDLDPEAAIADLSQAIAAKPGTAELLFRRGLWRAAGDHLDAAIADYGAALKLDPDYSAALLSRSDALSERNDHSRHDLETAAADLTKLIQRFPASVDLNLERGFVLSRDRRFVEAMADFDRTLKLRPNSASVVLARAGIHAELQQFDAAGADFSRAVELEPDLPDTYVARGNFFAQIGRDNAALADFEHAIDLYPSAADAYSGRAYVLMRQGNTRGALQGFNKALSFDDKDAFVLGGRGSLFQITGDDASAIRDYTQAVDLAPAEPYTPLLLNIAKARAGKPDEAKSGFAILAANQRFDDWPRALAGFLAGTIDDAALARIANQGDEYERRARAFDRDFYTGQAALLAGNTERAKRLFAAVIATGDRQYLEYNIAAADLVKLGGDPAAAQ